MKVLFVCRRNNGRSQLAKALYNKLTNSDDADSCGIEVDNDGQTLIERSKESGSEVDKVIEVIKEIGADISNSKRTQLRQDQLANYDKVVVMLEREMVPDYIKKLPNAEYWYMKDPKGNGLEGMREGRDAIHSKIEQLLLQ